MKHTPTPWGEFLGMLIGPKNQDIGLIAKNRKVCTPLDRANAAHIVKCVNAHDDLVKFLKMVLPAPYESCCNNKVVDFGRELLSKLEDKPL